MYSQPGYGQAGFGNQLAPQPPSPAGFAPTRSMGLAQYGGQQGGGGAQYGGQQGSGAAQYAGQQGGGGAQFGGQQGGAGTPRSMGQAQTSAPSFGCPSSNGGAAPGSSIRLPGNPMTNSTSSLRQPQFGGPATGASSMPLSMTRNASAPMVGPGGGSSVCMAGQQGTPSMPAAQPREAKQGRLRTKTDDIFGPLYAAIDADNSGSISMLEFASAVQRDPKVNELLLPGIDGSTVMVDEKTFEAVNDAFEQISGGKQRIDYAHFAAHFAAVLNEKTESVSEMKVVFDSIKGSAKVTSFSKLQLLDAIRRDPRVNSFVLPGADCSGMLNDQAAFDRVNSVFDAIAKGNKRVDYVMFSGYFKKVDAQVAAQKSRGENVDRRRRRVLVIGPGFGEQNNPLQGEVVERAGYQVHWVRNIPNPDVPGFPMMQHLPTLKQAIDEFKPDVICVGSYGGGYMVALWNTNWWTGPTVFINAHPSLVSIPNGQRVMLCHGSNDEYYQKPRQELERIIGTAAPNSCYLFYSADSGRLASGQLSRIGDKHNMDTLLVYDTLPRLIDAALATKESPEMFMCRSWKERLSKERLDTEAWLGYTPDQLRRFWQSAGRRGQDAKKTFDVPRNSEEFQQLLRMFRAQPVEQAAYCGTNYEAWVRREVVKIERVENGLQSDGNAKTFYESLRMSIEEQDIHFEPGVHTRWVFHGTEAIESIVNNPMSGFQPLASGTKGASLWGSGTYFARDAKYCAEGGFCKPRPDGLRQMLAVLLAVGIPCLGDPDHHGVLPIRQGSHRYNSVVDSLTNPEIFVINHPGAAYAAYVITFQ